MSNRRLCESNVTRLAGAAWRSGSRALGATISSQSRGGLAALLRPRPAGDRRSSMDEGLAAACPHSAYVDEAANAIEAVLQKAAARLVDEH
jgi:hypothetical protein